MRSEAKVRTCSWSNDDGMHTGTYAEAKGSSPMELAVAGDMAGKIGAAQSVAHAAGTFVQDGDVLPGERTVGDRLLPNR